MLFPCLERVQCQDNNVTHIDGLEDSFLLLSYFPGPHAYTEHQFRIYAAMFSGQSRIALETVTQLEASIPEAILRVKSPPMADWLESFLTMRIHVLIRFGLWRDILKLPLLPDQDLYCVTTATTHYAQGIAYAATGHIAQAETSRLLFHKALKQISPTRTLFNNTCTAILAIAVSMLDGELAYRQGNIETAFTHLQQAITLSDTLPYDEPWGWMHPPRHVLGALLLEQNRVEEAKVIYSADLGFDKTLPRALQHPNNIWALHGYHECLMKLGRTAEAGIVKPQLRLAVAIADVPVESSCFCRRGT